MEEQLRMSQLSIDYRIDLEDTWLSVSGSRNPSSTWASCFHTSTYTFALITSEQAVDNGYFTASGWVPGSATRRYILIRSIVSSYDSRQTPDNLSYVIDQSLFTGAKNVTSYLGRPWGILARVIVQKSLISSVVYGVSTHLVSPNHWPRRLWISTDPKWDGLSGMLGEYSHESSALQRSVPQRSWAALPQRRTVYWKQSKAFVQLSRITHYFECAQDGQRDIRGISVNKLNFSNNMLYLWIVLFYQQLWARRYWPTS